jgi:hypothetical protein
MYTLWVGGSKLNSYSDKHNAEYFAQEMIEMGYDDVVMEFISE